MKVIITYTIPNIKYETNLIYTVSSGHEQQDRLTEHICN